MSDPQAHIRKTVEIAFAHLQRTIVVDKQKRTQWNDSEKEKEKLKETDYEKLGDIHLLSHKIWAFKINAAGERTDLVLSEPIKPEDVLYQSVEGLVLTEWKVVREDNSQTIISNALEQAQRYRTGSLYSLMLHNYCYLVLVSETDFKIEKDTIIKDNVTFRIIKIITNPESPSVKRKKVKS